jgi:5-methylcytosine-specific restriction endonuclease McrA
VNKSHREFGNPSRQPIEMSAQRAEQSQLVAQVSARQHGGETELHNLALACWTCNLKKGPNLTGIDPASKEFTGPACP